MLCAFTRELWSTKNRIGHQPTAPTKTIEWNGSDISVRKKGEIETPTWSDIRSLSWMRRARNEFGSRDRVVFVVRKQVPPTFSFTHWLLPCLDSTFGLFFGFKFTVDIIIYFYRRTITKFNDTVCSPLVTFQLWVFFLGRNKFFGGFHKGWLASVVGDIYGLIVTHMHGSAIWG